MSNRRRAVEAARGRPVPDRLWNMLEAAGTVGDAEAYPDPVAFLVTEIKELARDVQQELRPAGSELVVDQPGGAAVVARAEALAAIYAAWAERDVEFFRNSALPSRDADAWKAFLARSGPHPGYQLLTEDELEDWIRNQYNSNSASGVGEDHIQELIGQMKHGGPDPTVNLHYTAGGRSVIVTVEKRSRLGDLAELADTLANRYRWNPADAATFALTGRRPAVATVTVGLQLRYGLDGSANTRLTLIVDPSLTAKQVSDVYAGVRARLQPATPRRSLSIKHLRLAEHVGPHLFFSLNNPGQIKRPGRPPQARAATNLVQYVIPASGHSWEGLRHSWNERYGDQGDDGRPWRYLRGSNFTRDARTAVLNLLNPGWNMDPAVPAPAEEPADAAAAPTSTERPSSGGGDEFA